mmetsp:Transcript_46970/g.134047  ORF Transcript_46970/g.134047 Transcript_46970/m.134047 type:complete len:202 (-) Transcript_46970:1237-1842(-)
MHMVRTFSIPKAVALVSFWNWGRPVANWTECRKSCRRTPSEPSDRSTLTQMGSAPCCSTVVCTRSLWLKSSSTASSVSPLPLVRLQPSTTSLASSRALASRQGSSGRLALAHFRSRSATSVARTSTVGFCMARPSRQTRSRVRSVFACSRSSKLSAAPTAPPCRLLLRSRTHSSGMTIASLATFLIDSVYSSRFLDECRLS